MVSPVGREGQLLINGIFAKLDARGVAEALENFQLSTV
jgi:hypothetical protein